MPSSDAVEPDRPGAPEWVRRALLDGLLGLDDVAVFAKDRDGRYLLCNEGAADIVGLSLGDIIGRSDHELYAPIIAERFQEHDLEVIEGGRAVPKWIPIPAAAGPETWYSHLFPLVDDTGEVVGVSGFVLDVTERAEATLERRELERRLQQAQRLETVGQLAGGMAHDFNNLLAIMAMQTELLAAEYDRDSAAGRIDELRSTIDRASALTRQLLVFSRHDDVGDEVAELPRVLGRLRPLLERSLGSGVQLRMDMPSSVPAVPADPAQIEQLVVNLAVNARDAMPDGGCLTIVVDVPADDVVRIVVADTGVGMSEEVRAKAFDPFFSTKPPGVGTGLGLSTVHGIVTRSGGEVRLHPRPSGGTSVEVRLPAALHPFDDDGERRPDGAPDGGQGGEPPSRNDQSMPGSTPLPPTGVDRRGRSADGAEASDGKLILIVDDVEPLRRLAAAALERAGYRTLVAGDGAEAWGLAAESPIDLLLTDIVMPGMSGRELADRMLAGRPDLPLVYMTGYTGGMLELADHADSLGAEILTKPFAVAELLDAVDRQLARNR